MKSSSLHLVFVLVIGVLVFIGYGIWYSVVSAKSTSVVNLQNQIKERTEEANSISYAREALEEISSDGATIQNYFVPKNGVVSFINNLQAQGKALGSTMSVLSVSTGTSGTQPILILSVTVKGTFDSVMRTVGVIEYAPYDLSISSFSIGQEAKNEWRADLGLTVGSSDSTDVNTP